MGLIHYENDFESLIRDKAVVDFLCYLVWPLQDVWSCI